MTDLVYNAASLFPGLFPPSTVPSPPVSQITDGSPQAPTSPPPTSGPSSTATSDVFLATTSGNPPGSSRPHDVQGLSTAEKAGIGVGAATALLALLGALWFLLWRSYQFKERRANAFTRPQIRGSDSSFQPAASGGKGMVQMREGGGDSQQPLIGGGLHPC